ncbi:hypothetical protein P3S68_031444 [Capsicum galapagoense]
MRPQIGTLGGCLIFKGIEPALLEGYNLFIEMIAQIKRDVIHAVYQFKPVMVKLQDQKKNDKVEKLNKKWEG